jgi:hypothetical protein
MASISSKLAPKHKQNLATLWETESKDALKALFKLLKSNIADKSINAVDFHQVKWLQGQYTAVESLEKEFEAIHSWSQKR